MKYKDEVDWLVTNKKRNEFIKNLALSLKGNTIIFYQYVDKHGKPLYDLIKAEAGDRPVYFVSGEIDSEIRNKYRSEIEKLDDVLYVVSYGSGSTGSNIRKIKNVIFSSPSKSRIKVLQSLGRGLRLSKDYNTLTVFDIADDLSWKKRENHTLGHFKERIKLYNEENFNYKLYNVKL